MNLKKHQSAETTNSQSTKTTNSQSTKTTKSSFQTNRIIAKSLMLLVAVALLFLCSVGTPTYATPTNDGSTIKITYPSNGSFVNIQETVTGTAESIPEGQKLWILVYPLTANKFYPQSENVNVINGNWSHTIGLGTADNFGENFKIIAVLADQEANEELTNYINTGPSTGWPGISTIPVSAKVLDEVTVTRFIPEINITPPSNITSVNMTETLTGTAKNIPNDYKVWILVHPLATNKLYPQNKNVDIINGRWSLPIGIGVKENVGETFEIIAVLANQKANEEFTNYTDKGKNTTIWPGMDSIPDGAKEYDKITVTRKIEPMVNITSPLNTAKRNDTITGTAKYIPEGQKPWIAIYPQNAYKYYPQPPVDVQSDGSWTLSVQFGLENSTDIKFDIIALLANQSAQNEFSTYINMSYPIDQWPGMQKLPDGTQELARVTVTRIGDLLPVADFNANTTSGSAPLTVQFTDLSQNAVSRSWDFGDRTNSTEQNPLHIYSTEGTYNVNLIVRNANGTALKPATISVQNQGEEYHSSSSSSGGSGGGGGGSPEPQSNVEAKEISQTFVSSGKPVKFEFPKDVTPVANISFDSKKTVGKTTTIVEMLKNTSLVVKEPAPGEVYKNINIWIGYSGFATPKNIENPVVCFKVNKSWIQDKNIDKSSITLNRYNNAKWEQLQISQSGEDGSYLYFTAETKEFSFFAITGKSKLNTTTVTDESGIQTGYGNVTYGNESNATQQSYGNVTSGNESNVTHQGNVNVASGNESSYNYTQPNSKGKEPSKSTNYAVIIFSFIIIVATILFIDDTTIFYRMLKWILQHKIISGIVAIISSIIATVLGNVVMTLLGLK